MPSPIKYQVTLSFCELTLHDDYVYVIMNEGITVKPEHNDILKVLALTYFADKNFVYISHRLYSYSVDPLIYLETQKIPNLKGFVVVNSHRNSNNPDVEKLFFSKPFEVVETLDKAFARKNKLLNKLPHNQAV